MENPAKRPKLEADPMVILCDDVHDLIFQHLEGIDVLESFKVSMIWNFRLSQSSAAMKSVKLNLSAEDLDPSATETLLESERRYQNLKVHFKNQSDWSSKLEVFEKLSASIVDLHVTSGLGHSKQGQNIYFTFPNLNSMTIDESIRSKIFGIVIDAAPNLEKLSIIGEKDCITSEETVRSIGRKTMLKEITFSDDHPSLFTCIDNGKALFKLTSLEIKKASRYKKNPKYPWETQEELLNFLALTSETLTTLKLHRMNNDIAVFVLTKLPELKVFECKGASCHPQFVAGLENFSITSVRIGKLDSFFKQLLLCMKNLQSLSMEKGNLRWVKKNRGHWDDLKNIDRPED